jgi:ATP-binding cassette subfamily B protein
VEEGSHAELLRRGGLYADMWARQQAEQEQAQAAE